MMNVTKIALFATALSVMAACSSTRYTSSTEYDDVYYSSSDRTAVNTPAYEDEGRDASESPSSYRDYYYEDDDFTFSRRVRRFNQASTGSWRYYDPYFSNDLYYVMGTPSWNTWYGNGWYSWNRPFFSSYWGASPFGFNNNAWGNSWGNSWGWNAGYYNPWADAYFGYSPFYTNPWGWNTGWGGGWNTGWGGGFNPYRNPYYCPPIGAANFSNTNNIRTVANRAGTGSVISNVGNPRPSDINNQGGKVLRPSVSGDNAGSGTRPAGNVPTRAADTYLTPAPRTLTPARPSGTPVPIRENNMNSRPATLPGQPSSVRPGAESAGQPAARPATPTFRPSQPENARPNPPVYRPNQPESARPAPNQNFNQSPRSTPQPSRSINPSAPQRPTQMERSSSPSFNSGGGMRPSGGSFNSGGSSPMRSTGGGGSSPVRRP